MKASNSRERLSFNARYFLLHSFFAVFLRGSGGALGVFSAWMISRLLGADTAGFYFFGFAALTILSVFSRFGFDKTVFKIVSKNSATGSWDNVFGILFQSVSFVFFSSFSIFLFIYFLSDYFSNFIFGSGRAAGVFRIISATIPLMSVSSIVGESLQALGRNFSSAFILFVAPFFFLSVQLVWIWFFPVDVSADFISGCMFFSYVFTALVGLLLLWTFLPRRLVVSPIPVREIFSGCFPLFLVDAMATLTTWVSQIYVGYYLLPVDVALLASSQRLAAMVSMLFSALIMITAPRFAVLYANGMHDELKEFFQKSMALTLLVAVPVILVICIFSGFLLSLFGEDFQSGAAVLRILTCGLLFNALNGFCSYLLVISGNEKMLRTSMVLGCLIAVLLPNILIPAIGVSGAVFSAALGWAVQCGFSVFFVQKAMGFGVFDKRVFSDMLVGKSRK